MNCRLQPIILVAFVFAALMLAPAAHGQTAPSQPEGEGESAPLEAPSIKKDLYPAGADAKKEIAEALQTSARDHKRVLLIFGGNWCLDCHVLDGALHEGAAGKIMKDNFMLVHMDIGAADKNLDLTKKYKIPLEKGVPAVAVLNAEGELLYSSGDGEFEAARRMMKKDLVAFLMRWQEKLPPGR